MCPAPLIWPDLASGDGIAEDRLAALCRLPVECWVLRSYFHLRPLAETASLGPDLRPDRVNIANVYDLGRRHRLNTCFVLTTQGDGYRSALGNFNIRQNGLEPDDAAQGWVPIWMQPGIRPRAAKRGADVTRAAYRGHPLNLIPALRAEPFQQALAAEGITFDDGTREEGAEPDWQDYSEVDAVVAIRDATIEDLHNKPASKLVNAWAGGVPAILGPEPAYRELRRGPLDYIEAGSADDAAQALIWLKRNPDRYAAMVQNGLQRAREFTDAALTARWIALLNGPVASAFAAWQARGLATRWRAVISMLIEEPRRRKQYEHERDHGARLFANPA